MSENERLVYIPLGDCEICTHLGDVETSFSKYGWEDMTYSMPPQAGGLVLAENLAGYAQENHHVKRCPACGVYYQYDYTHEYLVDGSEDEVTLTRLTPDEARRFYSDKVYAFLIEQLSHSLGDGDAKTRAYAARCLVAHHLARGELGTVEAYLMNPDGVVAQGALLQLRFHTKDRSSVDELRSLVPVLRSASRSPVKEVADLAGYLLTYVFKTDVG